MFEITDELAEFVHVYSNELDYNLVIKSFLFGLDKMHAILVHDKKKYSPPSKDQLDLLGSYASAAYWESQCPLIPITSEKIKRDIRDRLTFNWSIQIIDTLALQGIYIRFLDRPVFNREKVIADKFMQDYTSNIFFSPSDDFDFIKGLL